MVKKKISRRDFIKVAWVSFWGAILAACKFPPEEDVAPTNAPTSTNIPKPEPQADVASEPAPTDTPTETPTPTPEPCFTLLEPENGATLLYQGRVAFVWEEQKGAASYKLIITLPNELVEEYETDQIRFEKYLGSLPMGGDYHWQIIAFDSTGTSLCQTETFAFNKPTAPTPTTQKSNKGSGSTDSCFLAGTLIRMADGSTKPIEDVKVGDSVFSFDLDKQEIIQTSVLALEQPIRDSFYTLTFADDSTLKLTAEHPLYAKITQHQGWYALDPQAAQNEIGTHVEKLKEGCKVMRFSGEWAVISSITHHLEVVQTYNLKQVSDQHNFFANGVLAHNKGGEVSGNGSE